MSNKETNQEPIFEGSFKDFKKFLGDYVKNSVPELTKKYKDALGKCEYCNAERSKKTLDTAHIIDRPILIKEAFEKATIENDGDIHTVDLNIFCIYNKLIHYDYNNFYILCKKCHDASHGKISTEERDDLKNKGLNDDEIKEEVQKRKKEFADKIENKHKNNIEKLEKIYQSNLLEIPFNEYIDMLFSVLNEKCRNGEEIEKILKHKKLDEIANKHEFENTKKIFAKKKSKKDATMQLKKYFDNKTIGNNVKNLKDYLIEHYKIEHKKYINKHFKNKQSSDKS